MESKCYLCNTTVVWDPDDEEEDFQMPYCSFEFFDSNASLGFSRANICPDCADRVRDKFIALSEALMPLRHDPYELWQENQRLKNEIEKLRAKIDD